MKKILIYSLFIVLGLSACEKEDKDTPLGTSDERLNEALVEYKDQLVNAENGWKATLFPSGGAGYSFLFDFSQNDRVTMLSDINPTTSTESFESTYRLKAMQHPSLLFDTYSYLHILSDPDASKSGGDYGQGKYSDFEFRFVSATPDSIVLSGIYNESKLILVRATQDEARQYIGQLAKNAEAFEEINNFTTYFKRLTIGNKSYDMAVDTERRNLTFTYKNGGVVSTFTTSYYFTANGVHLLEPFSDGEISIPELTQPVYYAANRRIDIKVPSGTARIVEASQPAVIDEAAAERFKNAPPNGSYWYTVEGFTVEGEKDAFNITSLPKYFFTTFYIQPDPPYDALIFWTTDDDFYGPALRTRTSNDGKIFFVQEGEFGTVPEEAAPAVNATRDQLTIPEGYYVIKSADGYDLVSAKDAKAWINFY